MILKQSIVRLELFGVTFTWIRLTVLLVCLVCIGITTTVTLVVCCLWCHWYCEERRREHRPPKRGKPQFEHTTSDGRSKMALSPHFWGLDTDKTSDYGSLAKSKGSKGQHTHSPAKPPVESTDKYTYARIRLFFTLTNTDIIDHEARLVAIETDRVYFHAKDLFLELRNCKATSPNRSFQAVGFHSSLGKMRKKYELSDTLKVSTEFQAFSPELAQPDEKAEFARLFVKRARNRHYVATGYVAQLQTFDASEWMYSSREGLDTENDTHAQKKEDEGSLLMEMSLTFIHDPADTYGSMKVSLAYLPTAEKLSVEVTECVLRQNFLTSLKHMSHCFWKLTLMQKNKRHSRRRVSTVPLTNHMTWSEGSHTFDWIARDSVNTLTLVLSLVGIQSQKDTSDSDDKINQSVSPSGSRSPDHDTADCVSITSHDTGIGSLNEYSPGKKDSTKSETIAEVYVGSSVPENKCITQWQAMLLQPRQAIIRWQEIY